MPISSKQGASPVTGDVPCKMLVSNAAYFSIIRLFREVSERKKIF